MQFALDFQVAEVVDGKEVNQTSVITSVQLEEYGVYTLNYTDIMFQKDSNFIHKIVDAVDNRQERS